MNGNHFFNIPKIGLCIGMAVMLQLQGLAQIRISQLYGGGGNIGATFNADYVELFNAGQSPVSLIGYSIQYSSGSGTTWTKADLTGSMSPGKYFLIQMNTGVNGSALPLPADQLASGINMSGTAGKLALVNGTTNLTGSCPLGNNVVDFVGYGTADCSESAAAPAPSNTIALWRKNNGCTDTDNNLADFTLATPNPQNSLALPNICSANSQANGKVGIGVSSPHSQLQVAGSFAIGVMLAVPGGTAQSPANIDSNKVFIGIMPTNGADTYLLPNPASCKGRMYIIRNYATGVNATILSASGLLCPGNGACLTAGTGYIVNANTTAKTIMAISDGSNWIMGKLE